MERLKTRLKNSLCLSFAVALALLALPGFAAAQTNGARAGTAVVSGENSYVILQDKEGGATLTRASFWRVHWSPAGTGHVCYITVGEAGAPEALRIALYDNEKLYKYLTDDVLAANDPTIASRPFTAIGGAKFSSAGDSIHERTESCTTDKYKVQLAWHDLQTPELMDSMPGTRGPYGLTYLRILGKTADVTVNGKKMPGTAYGRAGLAFGETWLKK